jgi:hypothetical protein
LEALVFSFEGGPFLRPEGVRATGARGLADRDGEGSLRRRSAPAAAFFLNIFDHNHRLPLSKSFNVRILIPNEPIIDEFCRIYENAGELAQQNEVLLLFCFIERLMY